jgi:uroporphyrin-III C-methyltransferase
MEIQKVYIVGAGPGNPELLTVKALRLLQEYAEVVIYDRLIPNDLLDLIPEKVERIYAGKSCKKHTMTQEDINKELVAQAQTGKKIVRLKGGDPFIFGRGGEEMEFLARNDIPFEVVPGISAASGISAIHNIPLTHRGVATGVRFVTGHQQKGKPVELDWQSLADPMTTIVVYMGLANIDQIAENLIKHGLPASTPLAAIQNGTTTAEKKLFSTLGMVANQLKERNFSPPALIIIGDVVGL